MDNFAAGVMAKNGLGYADLAKSNPQIIVVSMSMAGQNGPERSLRGFASISSAYVGLEGLVGYPEENMTTGFMAFGLGDTTQSIQAVSGALAALIHRERTGQGQFVDMSQISSLCASLGEPLLDYQLNHRVAGLMGNRHTQFAPHGIYPCDNGTRWVAIAVRDEGDWLALCGTLERSDWRSDGELRRDAARRARCAELDRVIADWCRPRNRDEIVEQLCAAGVPAAPVLELPERNSHAAFAGRELVLTHEGGTYEPCMIYATPWSFTATPPVVSRPTPAVGEHNEYVYKELLGLDDGTISRLKDEKVLV
jgi:crotonobetainyl-CoA:carnitine CoA-transferase CaiB-like acyl-CoA transferase